jgi:DinB superfamily
MSETIRQHLLELLDGKSAHIGFEAAVNGFPANGLHTRLEKSPHTAWQLLEHIRLAQNDILSYCREAEYKEKKFPDGYWNLDSGTAGDWQSSVDQILSDRKTLRGMVADESVDLLAPLPNGPEHTLLREILVLADHNAYHLGQIMLLRRMIEAGGAEV